MVHNQLNEALALHEEVFQLMLNKGWLHPYHLNEQYQLDMKSAKTTVQIAQMELFPKDTARLGLFATPDKKHWRKPYMKAVTFQGIKEVEVKEVQEPKFQKADDMIIRLTSTAICGSDLHLIHGMIPNMPQDFIIGHEPDGHR